MPLENRRIARRGILLLLAGLPLTLVELARADSGELFRQSVAPIFEQRCLSCHHGAKPKGGLSLADAKSLLAGGESGPAFVAGKPDESLLLSCVSGPKPEMPKDGPPLTAEQVAAVRHWIESGAAWPDGLTLIDKRQIDAHWWSLEPLARPPTPESDSTPQPSAAPALPHADSSWVRNPIDAFVLVRMLENGLKPAPEADRRTLIRRVYFDVIGLPPSFEEINAFVNDPDPQAYEKLIDRLLDSPRYGERWARHWLDVVHYGESHGYDKDKPRLNAWPYRDYVIRAFNSDKPYTGFVQEQLAGDVLFPGTSDGVEALGFISAGPWDFIGHAEVSESKIDGKIARHLDRDDMVGATIGAFMSLTVQCAQCHNHKFDPIPQEDYYRLQAVFAALDRADKPYDADPAVARERATLLARQRAADARSQAIAAKVKALGGAELAQLDAQIAAAQSAAAQASPAAVQGAEFGYHSAIENDPHEVKWVQVDLGARIEIKQLVYTPCHDDFNKIGAGFGFPLRFKIEVSDDAEFKSGVRMAVDQTQADAPNPGTQPQRVTLEPIAGRYVRVTATRLAPRKNDYIFALAELAVLDAAGGNVALNKPVTALDSIEAGPRWAKKNLVDGLAPIALGGARDESSGARDGAGSGIDKDIEPLAKLAARRESLLAGAVDEATRREQIAAAQELATIGVELSKLPPAKLVYAGTVHSGTGDFAGVGPAGKPRRICVLARGDVRNPGQEVTPGALSRVPGLPGELDLAADHAEGDRRAALARWLTDAKNPLTWRSIVNRVWLYHFGRGIVDTPNDFGRMGQLPSHPELLDWLAVEFRDSGQSFKRLHRLLLTSATYRQSSAISPQAAASDAQNVWYSHMSRRRLEAEAVRDSVLLASGKLNLTMYGPSFQDFVVEKPEHSPHYQYQLYDPDDPASHRRSIYRFIIRSQQQPLLAALDCADPSLMVDKRNQTISPLAALAMLNNQLTVAMAKYFAGRVAVEAGAKLSDQVARAFRLALGRDPSAAELTDMTVYAEKHGMPSACRVILNLNEFVFVD